VNRLEDRIADLEGRLEQTADADTASFRGRETLSQRRTAEVLRRLRSVETDAEGALTAFVTPESLPNAVSKLVGDRTPLVRRASPCLVCADDAGLVAIALAPPCPPEPFTHWGSGFEVPENWFRPQDGDTLALVRSDLFVVGQFEAGADNDGTWTVVETVESDVKSAHSKGGFSQARFERRRDAQVDEHVEKAQEALDSATEGTGRLVVVGERTVLGAFEARADYVGRVDATGDPDAAFADAVTDFFSTTLSLL
jgi:peptide subunit release factor 1 (eRF1)